MTIPDAQTWLKEHGFVTNHSNHWSKYRVERKGSGEFKPWTVHHPTDPCSDYTPQTWFQTHSEAIVFAQREAFKAWVLARFEDWLEIDPESVDELKRILVTYSNIPLNALAALL